MCGRFSLTVDVPTLQDRFEASTEIVDWNPRYNIAPTQPCLVIVVEQKGRKMTCMEWGLVPHWSKSKKMGFQLINARAETAKTKPSYQDSYRHRRCLVPADGFYEWKSTSEGKIPYRVTLKTGEPFAFAGLWDRWQAESGQIVQTFTILTTCANELLSPLHDRMPVILPKQAESLWLDTKLADLSQLDPLFEPFPAEEMLMYEVSNVVNTWKIDSIDCILPAKKKTSRQQKLF